MAEVAEEPDVRIWADQYIANYKARMNAERARGVRPTRPNRDEVKRAVAARFLNGDGRGGSILTWIRILYWVMIIMAAL